MVTDQILDRAAVAIERVLQSGDLLADVQECLSAEAEVLDRFGLMFQPPRCGAKTGQDVKDFLAFKNNKHWTGLERQGPALAGQVEQLREALAVLSDSEVDLADRYDEATSMVKGLGRAITTAIERLDFDVRNSPRAEVPAGV